MTKICILTLLAWLVAGCVVPPWGDPPTVCEPGETQLCVYLDSNDQAYDGKRACDDDGMSWGDCVPLDLPSTGQGGSGGATDNGGSGGSTDGECTTDDDCATFNGACLVHECVNSACLAFERDDDGDGQSLCGGGKPGSWDCDDQEPTTYPGAEEICGDLIDNNCDGEVDEGCMG